LWLFSAPKSQILAKLGTLGLGHTADEPQKTLLVLSKQLPKPSSMLVRPRFLVTAKHIIYGPYVSPDFPYLEDHDEIDHYDQRFRSLFGVGPEVCGHIWHHLSNYSWKPPRVRPKHLLWTLMFLKLYSTELVLSVMARASRKTFRKWVWLLLPLIADMSPFVVRPLRSNERQLPSLLIIFLSS
jgi:hypothetical protein